MIKEVLEVSQENYNPSRLMTNTTYRNIQYKRKDVENIFTLQLFSLVFVFKFMTIMSHFPGSTVYHGSNFLYNYFFSYYLHFLHLMLVMISHRITEIR